MAKSRLSKRREVEAAEAMDVAAPKKKKVVKKAVKKVAKKRATKARPRKKKADLPARRRLIWVVYSSTMREEGRYLYHERDKAEEKLKSLLAKGKRRYFIQPIKEALDSEGNPLVPDGPDVEEKPKKVVPAEELEDAEVDESAEVEVVDDAIVPDDDGDE